MANVSAIAAKLHEFKDQVLALIAHVEAGVSHLNEDQTEEAVKQLEELHTKAGELRDETREMLERDEAADAAAAAAAQQKVLEDNAAEAAGSGTERYPENTTWADVGDGSQAPPFARPVPVEPLVEPVVPVEPLPVVEAPVIVTAPEPIAITEIDPPSTH